MRNLLDISGLERTSQAIYALILEHYAIFSLVRLKIYLISAFFKLEHVNDNSV